MTSATARFLATRAASLGETLRTAGPLAAAVVALGIALWTDLRERHRRPRLRLLFDPETDDFEVGIGRAGTQSHWVRLRVANRRGKRTAEDVEVMVVKVRPSHGDGSLSGFTLMWSNLPDSDLIPALPLPSRHTIPPGVERHVDLLHMPCPASASGASEADGGPVPGAMRLQAQPRREDGRHLLHAGKTEIVLALTARDANAVYYRVVIDFDGKWWPADRMKAHLGVSVARERRYASEPA